MGNWAEGHIFTKIQDEKKGMVVLCGIKYAGVLMITRQKT